MYEALKGTLWSTGGLDTTVGLGQDVPVYAINWHMIADYANELTAHHNAVLGTSLTDCYNCSGSGTSVSCTANDPYTCTGRLPTEAEWDYAARDGTTGDFWTSDGGGYASADICDASVTIVDNFSNPNLGDYAWFCGNSYSGTAYVLHPVAEKDPDGFGLFDMQGNALEWMLDPIELDFSLTTMPPLIRFISTKRSPIEYLEVGSTMRVQKIFVLSEEQQENSAARGYPYGFRLVRLANP